MKMGMSQTGLSHARNPGTTAGGTLIGTLEETQMMDQKMTHQSQVMEMMRKDLEEEMDTKGGITREPTKPSREDQTQTSLDHHTMTDPRQTQLQIGSLV